jgi:hypothetical protein
MKSGNKLSWIVTICTTVAFVMGGCASINIDPEAQEAFFQSLGDTSFTVFPAFVRGEDTSYDESAAEQTGEFLTASELGEVTISAEEVPITGSWGSNQAKMLSESAEDFAAYVTAHPIDTDYALMPEYLIGGRGVPVGIHCYIVDAEGGIAHVVLLNSHWTIFTEMDPQTTDDCTEVLIEVLREDLILQDSEE